MNFLVEDSIRPILVIYIDLPISNHRLGAKLGKD